MNRIHSQFKLNGLALGKEALYEVAYSWVKEGKDFEVDAGDFILDWLSPSHSIMVKTSGSTGIPKTIEITKEKMVNSALATASYFGIDSGDRALLCLSPKYIAGKMMLVRAMVLGLGIEVVAPTSHPLEHHNKEYTFSAMVPLQVINSLSRIHQIKKLIIGGAPISKSLREQLQQQPNAVFETYGMTETITHIAVKRLSGFRGDEADHYFEVLPNVDISTDNRGCLIINAPKVADEAIVTNDLVDLISAQHFKWLGRFDNIINSGGVKLIPEQIEEKLSKVMTQRFFVAGISDDELGHKLVLYVEGDVDRDTIMGGIHSSRELDKYEIPKQLYCVPQFMETGSGKIDRSGTMAWHSAS